MVRYTLFVLAVVGSAATALAAIQPGAAVVAQAGNTTVISKNQFWPLEGALVVEDCAIEDCSDTPQG
jgi:hypothetical protein